MPKQVKILLLLNSHGLCIRYTSKSLFLAFRTDFCTCLVFITWLSVVGTARLADMYYLNFILFDCYALRTMLNREIMEESTQATSSTEAQKCGHTRPGFNAVIREIIWDLIGKFREIILDVTRNLMQTCQLIISIFAPCLSHEYLSSGCWNNCN